ncbi:MAG: hypothetical protein J5993_00450 [Clostridia bacterium]|nr:hypothetical protein [Clostridia bacterium]
MKKSMLPIVSLVCAALLAGCSDNNLVPPDPPDAQKPASVHIYAPDGTPAMAIAGLKRSEEMQGVEVECTLVAASEIGTVFSAYPDCDLAIMPTVSAVQLAAQGMEISYVSANVWGNLYVVGYGEAESLSDLKGKVVYTTTGTTIALLEYELAANGIAFEMGSEAKDGVVTLYSMTAASDYLPLIKQAQMKGGEAYGVLGEPAVTKCMTSVATESKIVVDMQEEYKKLTGENGYPQASMIARGSFGAQYSEFIYRNLIPALSKVNDSLISDTENLQSVFEELGSTALLNIPYTADTIARCNLSVGYGQGIGDTVRTYISNLSTYVKPLQGIEIPEAFFALSEGWWNVD